MNCTRCNSPAYFEEFQSGEFIISCSICGFHSSQQIEAYHKGIPIYSANTNSPLGVVMTTKGNIPYYSIKKRDDLLKEKIARGHTYFDGNKWIYAEKEKEPVALSTKEVFDLM